MERGHQHRRAGAGFTLFELMIVIGIIALLTALAFSYADKVWKVARRVNCMSNMRQVSAGYFQYVAANDGKLPACDLSVPPFGKASDVLADLPYLRQYVGETRAFHCPEDSRVGVRTYTVNDYLGGSYYGITHISRLENVRNAPTTLLLIEEQDPANRNGATGGFIILPAPSIVWADAPGIMHERGTCICMADGHVEHWRWEDQRTSNLPRTLYPRTADNPDLVKLQEIAGSTTSTTN